MSGRLLLVFTLSFSTGSMMKAQTPLNLRPDSISMAISTKRGCKKRDSESFPLCPGRWRRGPRAPHGLSTADSAHPASWPRSRVCAEPQGLQSEASTAPASPMVVSGNCQEYRTVTVGQARPCRPRLAFRKPRFQHFVYSFSLYVFLPRSFIPFAGINSLLLCIYIIRPVSKHCFNMNNNNKLLFYTSAYSKC